VRLVALVRDAVGGRRAGAARPGRDRDQL
jgi:hypothetical protein